MRRLFTIILSAMLLGLTCTSCADTTPQPRKTEFPDNAFQEIPQDFFDTRLEDGGTVLRFEYETKDYTGSNKEYSKYAYVYLPHGYDGSDKTKKYDVMYFMHGGGGSEKECFGGALENTQTKCLFDNMIANGVLEPCIIVTPTYNNPHNGDATTLCKYFHEELVNDLIPAVEMEYNTYLEKPTNKAIVDSRLHRGFGGFSMGSACTWWVFEGALDAVAYYLPVSGDSWGLAQAGGASMPKETAEYLENIVKDYGYTKDDFFIYCGTGTNDMAYPNMEPMVNEMKKLTDTFVWCDNFKDGNFYFCVRDGGWHDYNTVHRIMFNGIPKFFG